MAETDKGKPTAAKPTVKGAAKSSPATSSSAKASAKASPTKTAAKPKSSGDETSVRPGLATQVKEKVSKAAQEHRDTVALTSSKPGSKQPRRARLRLTRVDPVSVMKVSFLLSIAFGIVTFVAVFITWSVLGAAGVWDAVNDTVGTVVSSAEEASTFDVTDYIGMSRVLGFTLVVSVFNVILLTAMATLAAFLYNMAAALLGGVEVTLAEDGR